MKKSSFRKTRRYFVRSQKRLVRAGLLTANLAVLFAVVFFVTKTPAEQAVQLSSNGPTFAEDIIARPLDNVSSADIAVNVARTIGLEESTNIVNHADSISALAANNTADTSVVAKPQIIGTALPTYKDIQEYTTVEGDSVGSIASKFGISSDSVRWSNGLTGSTISAGKKIVFPPAGTDGIVYTVVSGDTAESLALKFATEKTLIISYNDAEVAGLRVGQRILVPNGVVQAPAPNYTTLSYTFFGGGSYSKGWCTDYASARGGAPGGWGNANTWALYAARTPGWAVSARPRPGAIAQSSSGWAGHLGIVDAVSEDGTMIKYSDMNGLAGWGRVGYSEWVPVNSAFQNYIYRQ